MFRVHQQFPATDLIDAFDPIDPGPEVFSSSSIVGDSIYVLVPERNRLTCVSTIWGGGVPATEFLFDKDLNAALRSRRCLIPVSGVARPGPEGMRVIATPVAGLYAVAAVFAWSRTRSLEVCVAPTARVDKEEFEPSRPLLVGQGSRLRWAKGEAAHDVIELMAGRPWAEEAPWRLDRSYSTKEMEVRRPGWERLGVGAYRPDRDLRRPLSN